MSSPEYFEIVEGYACYRPVGTVSLEEGFILLGKAIAYARDNQIPRLLLDTTKLTGFRHPNTWDRYGMGKLFAEEARGAVIVALVAREELIDPQRFGVTVARNRGLLANVFHSESEAVAWLLDPDTQ